MALITTPYLATGNPDLENNVTLYAPGDLGNTFQRGDNQWQSAQIDSGATAAAGRAPTANDIMYWKNKLAKIVTNDIRFAVIPGIANSFANSVAGILRNNATPGNYVWLLQRGLAIPVTTRGSALTSGQTVTADLSNGGGVAGTAIGTAYGYQKLGIATGPTVTGNTPIDLNVVEVL